MITAAESDAAHLVSEGAKSRAGGICCLTDEKQEQFNGAMMVLAKTIEHVMSSAAEAEMLALFMNAQELTPLRLCLEELGHKQPPATIKTDNSTATGNHQTKAKQKHGHENALGERSCETEPIQSHMGGGSRQLSGLPNKASHWDPPSTS